MGKRGLVCAVREGMYKEWGKGAMSSHPAITRLSAISATSNSMWQCSSSEADMFQLTEPVVTALFTRVHHRSVTYLKIIQSKLSYPISSRPILKPSFHLPLDLSNGPFSLRSSTKPVSLVRPEVLYGVRLLQLGGSYTTPSPVAGVPPSIGRPSYIYTYSSYLRRKRC